VLVVWINRFMADSSSQGTEHDYRDAGTSPGHDGVDGSLAQRGLLTMTLASVPSCRPCGAPGAHP